MEFSDEDITIISQDGDTLRCVAEYEDEYRQSYNRVHIDFTKQDAINMSKYFGVTAGDFVEEKSNIDTKAPLPFRYDRIKQESVEGGYHE